MTEAASPCGKTAFFSKMFFIRETICGQFFFSGENRRQIDQTTLITPDHARAKDGQNRHQNPP
jgi:hypothetical protein